VSVIKSKKKLVVGLFLILLIAVVIITVVRRGMKLDIDLQVEKNTLKTNNRQITEPDYDQVLENHFLLTENVNFKMYFEESGMSVILVDKKTGKVLHTTRKVEGEDKNIKSWIDFMASGLSVEMLESGTRQTERYTMYSKNVTKTYTYYTDGFTADVDITIPSKEEDQHVQLKMNVYLTDAGIDVTVPSESIQDTVGDNVDKISSLYIYPFMGSTYRDEKEGYMFIPDGSGVLVSLEDHGSRFTTPYTAKIYGKDIGIDTISPKSGGDYPVNIEAEPIYIPLFGIVYSEEETGVMGLIKSGQESAEILAYPNGVSTDYNWITAQYLLRETYIHQTSKNSLEGITAYEKKLKGSNIEISYLFMTEHASYNQMANIYRDYLINQGILKKQDIAYKVGLDVIAAENEEGLLKKRTFSMTTTEEAANMIDELKAIGVDGLHLNYRGWQKGGYDDNFPIDTLKVEEKIGGKLGLKELINKTKDLNNVEVSLYDDFGIASKSRIYDTGKDIVKRIDKLIFEEDGYFLTPIKLLEVTSEMIPHYKNMEVSSLSISGVTKNLYTYISDNKVVSREQTKLEDMKVIGSVAEKMDLYMDAPYDYLWKYAKGIYNMPLSGSNYSYVSAEIPFLSIVLKGYLPMYSEYCNLNAYPTDYMLKLAESGTFPNFVITEKDSTLMINTSLDYIFTSQFDDYKDTILEYYNDLKLINEKVANAEIVEHQILENDFIRVTYSNGVQVYVNYTNKEKQDGSVKVESKSFKVVD
jgi:hypothetical protein